MKRIIALALITFSLGAFSAQTSSAMQVLAVSSNGKWAMVYEPMAADFNPIVARAEAQCAAKGGRDIRIVWSQGSNRSQGSNTYWGHPRIAHGAIAVSDNGTGTIVGWSFNQKGNGQRAKADCLKKGGQNPKVVSRF
jgi:hypothetical protein